LAIQIDIPTVSATTVSNSKSHCAFTDITQFNSRLVVVYREAQDHMSTDGSITIITSNDWEEFSDDINQSNWRLLSRVKMAHADLRDPKIYRTSKNKLILLATAKHQDRTPAHQTYLWRSVNGVQWSEPTAIANAGEWLWRLTQITPNQDNYLGLAYSCNGSSPAYISTYQVNLTDFQLQRYDKPAREDQYPNEHGLCFDQHGTAYCLLRRDAKTANSALLGSASPPYQQWQWSDLNERIGGPDCIYYKGQIIAVVRKYNAELTDAWVEIVKIEGFASLQPSLKTLAKIESEGDCGYPGLTQINDMLYISFYTTERTGCVIKLACFQLADSSINRKYHLNDSII
jgi:hypothetical protein